MTLPAPAGLPSCRRLAAVASLSLVLLAAPALASVPGAPTPTSDGPGVRQHSTGWLPAARSASCPDTLFLYGGPGTPEGKFQDANGVLPDEQGWTGVDLTDPANPWQLDSFNSPTGTQAAWCGRSALQEPGWVAAPGYGNSWNASLVYESEPVPDSAVGQVVSLDFLFNQDSEPGYDYLHVEYEKAGGWVEVYLRDGYTADSTGTHVAFQYAAEPTAQPIVYDGNDYGGAGNDRVRIRIRFTSDGAWSDEDGMWPTDGAVQVDDITVSSTAGNDFDDFQAGFGNWAPGAAQFAGDFFKVFSQASDLDPCVENRSPVATFIDDGSPVGNPNAIAVYGTDTTGGTTSLTWSYGVFGGWVVNYNGGLSNGIIALNNEMWSPPIAWDLPGTCDDGADFVGATFAFDVYEHLLLNNGIFRVWHIRFSTDGAATWGNWEDTNFVFYSATPRWNRVVNDVTAFVPAGVTHAQLALGVLDMAGVFAFPGADASPSPFHDNVSLAKYRIGGPSLSTRTIDLFQDSFPSGGAIDASTEAARDLLDIRVDMARDISTGSANVPGDSTIVDIVAVIPGSTVDLATTRMEWVLDRNPLFDSVRTLPAGAASVAGGAANGWDQWRGAVPATLSTVNGSPLQDRYYFDLPDANFLYPGDVLRYYIAATDDSGRESTLPVDVTGFDDGVGYSRSYTVRGLPSIVDNGSGPTQPEILFINDFGRRGGEALYISALGQTGRQEGVHFDTYTVQGPSSGVSNGIGGRANADQLGGYGCLLYVSGNLSAFTLSDGQYDWSGDKGDDIGVLTAWHDLPGDRAAAFFGDGIASDLTSSGNTFGPAFLQNILSANVNDNDVADEIGGQLNPRVVAASPYFSTAYVVAGGCPGINRFDSISAAGTAGVAHRWLDPAGDDSYPSLAASVVHDRLDGVDRRVDLLFPYGLVSVAENHQIADGDGRSARAVLLRELFDYMGHGYFGPATGADTPTLLEQAEIFPSPFNPSTTIRWSSGTASRNRVVVYDSRGRQVATLLDEERPAGPQAAMWDGRDAAGGTVASGVYLFEVVADERSVVRKGLLLK